MTIESHIESIVERAVARAMEKHLRTVAPASDIPELVTMKQAQKILGVGRFKILAMVSNGKLKLASGPGEKYRFFKSQILSHGHHI